MNHCKIIDKTDEAKKKKNNEGWLYGGETYIISEEELKVLLQGKCLATHINGAEYRIFIELEDKNINGIKTILQEIRKKEVKTHEILFWYSLLERLFGTLCKYIYK